MTQALQIAVVSDPVCPWCLLGLHRLDGAIARLEGPKAVQLFYLPFLLDSHTPKQGVDVRAMLMQKYGRAPDEMWDRLEREAELGGLALDMRAQTRRYPSQPALAVISAARSIGADYALGRDIGRAYYLEGRDIADPEVLAELAVAHGLVAETARAAALDEAAHAQVETEAAALSQQGVNGVPMFLFADKFALSGAQPEHVFDKVLADLLAAPDKEPGTL